ncbi:MAG: hypothetical protein VCD00_10540 [Candidatus Hydrogenedentota bacterium]
MKTKSNGWYWIGILALVAGLALYASKKNMVEVYLNYQQSEVDLQKLDTELHALEHEKLELERKVQGLGTDLLTVETTIRKDSGRVRKGETVYRIDLPKAD